jgi:hypothetical protein
VVVLFIHLSCHPSCHPSIQVSHPGRKDDGRGGGGGMAPAAVYPNILTIRNFLKHLKIETK